MTQSFEYLAAACTGFAALFVFFQVAIFGENGKGWIDRPWYIRTPMSVFGMSLVYKLFAFVYLHEHYTVGGALVSCAIVLWQFSSLLYAITESYKEKSNGMMKALFDKHPVWGNSEIPVYEPRSKAQRK